MSRTPRSSEELLNILQLRHKILFSARIEKKPGEFKDNNNFAGQTAFVDINLVKGTIIKCFDFYQALKHPFARAAYIMFAISEIHPFLDGNGRLACVIMNAEFVKADQVKIIISTVYRDDYLLALRKLIRQKKPKAYIQMLARAHQFCASVESEDMSSRMQQLLDTSNAFLEQTEGKLKI